MKKQQTYETIQCQTCGDLIPKGHIAIHTVRCNMKKQQFLMSKNSRLSNSRTIRKTKIFEQKKVEVQKEQQQKVPCPFCGYMQKFEQLDTHPSKCPGKQSKCEFCGDCYPSELMKEHEAVCESNDHHNDEESDALERVFENPIERLMRVIDLINSIGQMMRNMEFDNQGLSENQLHKLKRFPFRPGKEEELCTICYCKFQKGEDCLELKCRHIYHNECISKWLQKSSKCPLCKHDQKHSK